MMVSLTKRAIGRSAFMGLIFLLAYILPAFAKDAVITDIEVNNVDRSLLLYFRVDNCFTQDIKKAIDSGINTTFNFFIKAYETRRYLWDRKIADIKVSHDVQYDSLKKVYMIKLSEKDDKTIFIQNFDEVKKILSEVTGLRVAELQNLKKGGHYQVCMMAELDKIMLPFYLHNVFFFLSLWDFETDWYTVDFVY
jgi:hypothetical protein